MSIHAPKRPGTSASRNTFAIISSRYNEEFVDGLVNHAKAELAELAPRSIVIQHKVPGAFEIPFAVQEVASRGECVAILALGVILRGATDHADLIGAAVTNALMDAGLRYRLPVIHEVLLLDDEAQARERCLEKEKNRGTEAARVAVSMARWISKLASV